MCDVIGVPLKDTLSAHLCDRLSSPRGGVHHLGDDSPTRLSPMAPLTAHGTPGMVSTVQKPHDMQRTVH
jgi:hypothetical protein